MFICASDLPSLGPEQFGARFRQSETVDPGEAGYEQKQTRLAYARSLREGLVIYPEDWMTLCPDRGGRRALRYDPERDLRSLLRIALDYFPVVPAELAEAPRPAGVPIILPPVLRSTLKFRFKCL